MDSKSIVLCPQGFESPRCRFLSFDQRYANLVCLCAIFEHATGQWEALYISVTPALAVTEYVLGCGGTLTRGDAA